MPKYMVVGGTYADTNFDKVAPGMSEQSFGPYASYEEAKAEWAKRTWSQVDDATTRYRIEEVFDSNEAMAFYVVGGIYTSTSFLEIAGGGKESWHGPFATYEDAKREWTAIAFRTIDDALARYRIEKRRPSQAPA